MNLIEVKDKKTEKIFLNIAREIYKDDSAWICPLDVEIKSIFDPSSNKKFKNGKAIRWILHDDSKPVGRIAAFVDGDLQGKYEQPTGGIGFFESINNQEAANMLFDAAKKWLAQQGIEAMDGPVNFGSNDSYWGLLVDGFIPPAYAMPYHKPYYKQLFENYGFRLYYRQFSYHIDVNKFPDRFWKIAEWISRKPDYEVKYFRFKEQEAFVRDFVDIYNETWPSFKDDFMPIKTDDIRDVLNNAKQILIEDFIVFAYHKKKPIAFYINFPDINQAIKDFKGNLNLINKLRLLYRIKYTKTVNRLRGIIYGIKPAYQKKGIDAAMFYYIKKTMDRMPHILEAELSWIGDFNPKMIHMQTRFNAKQAKEYITYRYLFDRSKKFERFPIPQE